MRKLLRRFLLKPVLKISDKYSARPEKERVFDALTKLFDCITEGKEKKGLIIPFDAATAKFIIFSDQHKGARNGADDFALCEIPYATALDYYHSNGFHLISLGDSEELWENTLSMVREAHALSFQKEAQFISKNAFIKIFGNHDLLYDNDPLAPVYLKSIYKADVPIYEGVILRSEINGRPVNIFCTHGHQGDKVSDGNWFSKFFIARIWAPFQAYLQINPNTPAYDSNLKTLHNALMYQWSVEQKNVILVTGHTHQPVFESLTHIERLYKQLLFARSVKDEERIKTVQEEIKMRKFQFDEIADEYLKLKPNYFNTGCCCFADGDITGIEISEGSLRLVEWRKGELPERFVLEEVSFEELLEGIPYDPAHKK